MRRFDAACTGVIPKHAALPSLSHIETNTEAIVKLAFKHRGSVIHLNEAVWDSQSKSKSLNDVKRSFDEYMKSIMLHINYVNILFLKSVQIKIAVTNITDRNIYIYILKQNKKAQWLTRNAENGAYNASRLWNSNYYATKQTQPT